MSEWQYARATNKSDRINWRKVLGISLNEYVALKFGQGWDKENIISNILNKAKEKNLNYAEATLTKRIRIGVGARIGEMKMERTALKQGMAINQKWIAKVRKFNDGTRYIIISPNVRVDEGTIVKASLWRVGRISIERKDFRN